MDAEPFVTKQPQIGQKSGDKDDITDDPSVNDENDDLSQSAEASKLDISYSLHNGQTHDKEGTGRCAPLKSTLLTCTRPFLASSHPLSPHPSFCRKVGQWFLCPPSGLVAAILVVTGMFGLWWGSALAITGKEALPGGNLFAMLVVFIGSWCGGYVMRPTSLPPLLGMLLMGGILGNVPKLDVARQLSPVWASTARNIALTVILIRAGLNLDPIALKRLSFVVPRLAFCPSLAEVAVDGFGARIILGLPWTWAFMLAFVLSVVSPAVVVPSMLALSERGYGLNKGIPTLVIASCTLDAVLAITGFGILLGVSFSEGDIAWTVVKAPLEVLAGIVYGCATGCVMWYLPQKSSKNLVLFRSLMLVGSGLLAIFGSKAIRWSGSGPLGCLSAAFVAAHGWREDYRDAGQKNPVENVMSVLWMVFQPLLFGLIGAAVNISALKGDTVGLGMAVIFLGVAMRMLVAFVAVLRTQLNLRERFFIPMSWFPKATVQAAIGAVAYDTAVEKGATELIPLGRKVLTLAVLAILVTAPIGSTLIALTGPRLLHKTETDEQTQRQNLKPVANSPHWPEEEALTGEEEDHC